MRAQILILSCLFAVACGRGGVEPLSLVGGSDAGVVLEDASDGAVTHKDALPWDVETLPDVYIPPPDSGIPDVDFICRSGRDCLQQLGEPVCPEGNTGRWACVNGQCIPECPGVVCNNDCDCPYTLVCGRGECIPSGGRMNMCCSNPDCPPNMECVMPDGDEGTCPGVACINDCDCPRYMGCELTPVSNECVPLGRGERNECCNSPNCPPGASCDLPGGGTGICPSTTTDGGVIWDGAIPDGGSTPVGEACIDPDDCLPGFCIDENSGFPGGYCSQACGQGIGQCPAGATCRRFGDDDRYCLDICNDSSECRQPEYRCIQLGLNTERVCWPVDPGSTNPNGEPVGGACNTTNNCAAGLSCMPPSDWPGGYCTINYCDPVTNPCPTGSSCFAFPGMWSLCLADCPSGGSTSTCRADYYCLGPTAQSGVCIPN